MMKQLLARTVIATAIVWPYAAVFVASKTGAIDRLGGAFGLTALGTLVVVFGIAVIASAIDATMRGRHPNSHDVGLTLSSRSVMVNEPADDTRLKLCNHLTERGIPYQSSEVGIEWKTRPSHMAWGHHLFVTSAPHGPHSTRLIVHATPRVPIHMFENGSRQRAIAEVIELFDPA